MKIPGPAVRLSRGDESRSTMAEQTLGLVEKEIVAHKPDWVLVYGDMNSTEEYLRELVGRCRDARLFNTTM